jgi:hypothetical protein
MLGARSFQAPPSLEELMRETAEGAQPLVEHMPTLHPQPLWRVFYPRAEKATVSVTPRAMDHAML